jgi:hypothetical protein
MKTYIAGKITGLDNYQELFMAAEVRLKEQGHQVMNPSILPSGFEQQEYMRICFAMIDACERVYFLENWIDSPGANLEMQYARYHKKEIVKEGLDKNITKLNLELQGLMLSEDNKICCEKCGSWIASRSKRFGDITISSDYVEGEKICRACKEEVENDLRELVEDALEE